MSAIALPQAASAVVPPPPSGASGALHRVWQAMVAAHRMRQARSELMRLDDRLLADVGMSRHDLDPVVEALARSFAPGASPGTLR
jgi:uncharacterized protein YjiS (DUF1127 family)